MAEEYLRGLRMGLSAWMAIDETASELHVARTADGVRWRLPVKIRVKQGETPAESPAWKPLHFLVSGVGALIVLSPPQGEPIELGVGYALQPRRCLLPSGETSLELAVRLSDTALAALERLRNGSEPVFVLSIHGSGHVVLAAPGTDVATAPDEFYGSLRFGVSQRVWITALKKVGAAYNTLIEIPLQGHAPAGWEGVWNAVEEARTAFDHGGPVGWASCAARVREAFDQWASLRQAQLGPEDPDARSLDHRIDHVRVAVRRVTNLGAHGPATKWTRADALFLLTTLTTLLSRETS